MAQSLIDNQFYAVKAISKNFLKKDQKNGIVFLFYLHFVKKKTIINNYL